MSPHIVSLDRAEWERRTHEFPDYSFRQSWGYSAAMATRHGAASEHVAIMDGDTTLGLAEVRVKRIPMMRAGVAYISGGPLVRRREGDDGHRLVSCLDALRREFVENRGLVLRINPATGSQPWIGEHISALQTGGFTRGEPCDDYRTIVIDLAPPLDQLRRGLEQKWRNCLNKAEKCAVTVRSAEDESLFPAFIKLFDELIDRKGFSVNLDARFFQGVQQDLPERERLHVSIAEADGEPVAGHVASLLGDTCVYLLGATTHNGRKVNASYLLQWDVVRFAKERGAAVYDLGGIDPNENPGVHKFKTGMGGTELMIPAPFECVPPGFQGWITRVSERAYRGVRARFGSKQTTEASSTTTHATTSAAPDPHRKSNDRTASRGVLAPD